MKPGFWPRSFQARLVLLFTTLFILVQLATYMAVYQVTTRNLEGQISEHLIYSAETFNRTMQLRTDRLIDGASVLSTDFGFREAVATRDASTIRSALDNLGKRIGAHRAVLLDLDQTVLADTHGEQSLAGRKFPAPDLVDGADRNRAANAFIVMEDALYDFVIVPVLAPVPVAWVGIGILIDDRETSHIAGAMPDGMDISFVLTHSGISSEGPARFLATSLGNPPADLAQGLAGNPDHAINMPERLTIDGAPYLTLTTPLETAGNNGDVVALIQYSLNVAFSPYRPLVYALLVLLGLGAVVLACGSVFVARGVSRPLRLLTESAAKISVGNYHPVQLERSDDEFGQLAQGFNHMIDGIDERERKILFQAEHDSETGLPNRLKFEGLLEQLLRPRDSDTPCPPFSVIVVSVGRVNEVRNTLGYRTGEDLISLIGPRIRQNAIAAKMVARLSNVSFILALPGFGVDATLDVARKIKGGFDQPFMIGDITIDCGAEIGIANYPIHATTVDALIQKASIAVVQAANSTENIAVYNHETDSHAAERLSLMGELREGLLRNEVQFYYQPKIDLRLDRMTHVEALARWIHPKRGFVPPDEFVTLAEQTGHINLLTNWALDTAIGQCGTWHRRGLPVRTAINLSARDLTNKTLPYTIERCLDRHGVDPCWLVLEVTESAVMQDPEMAITVLDDLTEMGLPLSIDDYGTGYSSMSYLKKLPIQELKIDKSFILGLARSREDQILVRSTIDMAHSLGLKVTAEGVEDEVSVDLLREFGCDLVQGYFFSRPLSLADLDRFIETSPFGLGANHQFKLGQA